MDFFNIPQMHENVCMYKSRYVWQPEELGSTLTATDSVGKLRFRDTSNIATFMCDSPFEKAYLQSHRTKHRYDVEYFRNCSAQFTSLRLQPLGIDFKYVPDLTIATISI